MTMSLLGRGPVGGEGNGVGLAIISEADAAAAAATATAAAHTGHTDRKTEGFKD